MFPARCSGFRIAPLIVLLFAGAGAGAATDSVWRAVEAALYTGDIRRADSLFATVAATASTTGRGGAHEAPRRALLAARLAAARGDWKRADSLLTAWDRSPARRGGSGEALFWSGWSALHQGRHGRADSLFVLASAYGDEPASQTALEYRFAALLDSTQALYDHVRGLPESPLPVHLRAASLRRVPDGSPLYGAARAALARLEFTRGDTAAAVLLWRESARDPRTPHGQAAAANLARLLERTDRDSARAAWEILLLHEQHGVVPERARARVRALR